MPLTPQDVHSKVFGPTRFRRGYDEAEVDGFLDEVEAELIRLHREIDALRAQAGGTGPTAAEPESAGMPVTAAHDVVDSGPTPSTATAGAAQAAAQSVAQGGANGDLEQRVARTLVLAQRAADEAVRDAEQQAEQLRTSAQTEAERIRTEAEQHADLERRELERIRSQIEDDVEQLRAFEREYRTRLRAYLELQLRDLDEAGAQVEARQADAPNRTLTSASGGEGQSITDVGADKGHLLTSELPLNDPASVPPVSHPSDAPSVPPSVAVHDYEAPAGISEQSPGDELRREPRDLHDGL